VRIPNSPPDLCLRGEKKEKKRIRWKGVMPRPSVRENERTVFILSVYFIRNAQNRREKGVKKGEKKKKSSTEGRLSFWLERSPKGGGEAENWSGKNTQAKTCRKKK